MNFELHKIARKNLVNELNEILKQEVDINKKDEFGYTALLDAISSKNEIIAMILIEHGADVSVQDNSESTPLHYAVVHNLYDVAEAILKNNSQVINIADKHGNEPLWTAAFNAKGHYDLVKLCLRFGANVNHKNNVDLCPLDIPRRMGDDDLLKILSG